MTHSPKRLLTKKWARRLLGFSLGLVMLPGIWAIVLSLLAVATGCSPEGPNGETCMQLGESIRRALQFNISVMSTYIYTLGLPIWLIVWLAHSSFQGWRRLLAVLTCLWWVPHSHTFLGILATQFLIHDGCTIANACTVFGVDMSSAVYSQGTSLWLWFLSLPICGMVSLGYTAIALNTGLGKKIKLNNKVK